MKWIIGIGIIIVCVAATSVLNFGDDIVYFYTPTEAIAKNEQNRTIKIGGMVSNIEKIKDEMGDHIRFTLRDKKESLTVIYAGIPPDMFKEHQGVVVEGRLANDRRVVAHNLMVKHSEEYKKPDDHHSMEKELLERSMFKGTY